MRRATVGSSGAGRLVPSAMLQSIAGILYERSTGEKERYPVALLIHRPRPRYGAVRAIALSRAPLVG